MKKQLVTGETVMPDYQKKFSEKGFWAKIAQVGKKVPFARDALAMYFCMMDPTTPLWAKGVIIGALGYFIFPLDAIPDILIPLGFTDDAAIVAAALALIRMLVKEEHWTRADKVLANL